MMLWSAALLAVSVVAVRQRRQETEASRTVAGVPILNYRYRYLQHEAQMEDIEERKVFEWVLNFKTSATNKALSDFCHNSGDCSFQGHAAGVPFVTVHCTEDQLKEKLEGWADFIDFAEPDTPVKKEKFEEVAVQQKEGYWHHAEIGLPQAQFSGDGVHIYVMDTGIRTTHEDFQGRAIPTVDTFQRWGKVECDPADSSCAGDTDGHGTHVAGTAGGSSFGVAKQATLHAMKVCCGYGSNILGGMDWLVMKAEQPAVMTMSLGSYSMPESSRRAVNAVVNAGITVTVSAGNADYDSCLKSYTFIPSAIGVGASTPSKTRASFSNYGRCNAIFAPGTAIVSAGKSSDTATATMQGTSMAAPSVAGAVAMLLEENPTLSPSEIRSTLRERAQKDVLSSLKPEDPNLLLFVG